jgi:O-antigen/teichoic acid export membrane protein
MANELPSTKRTVVNVTISWAHKGLVALASLITIPIIIEHLGFEGLGVWLMVLQVSRTVQPINMGINGSLGRLLAKADALGDSKSKGAYISVSLLTLAAIGVLICIGGYVAATNHMHIVDAGTIYQNDLYWAILIALISVGIGMPLRTGMGMLEAHHQFYRVSLWELLGQALWIVGLILVIFYGQVTLFAIAIVYFGPAILKDIALFLDGMRVQGWPNISVSNYRIPILKEIISLGLASAVIAISVIAIRQGAPLMVGFLVSLEALTLVSIPIMMIYGISPFINISTNLIVPVSSRLAAKNDKTQLYDIYIVASKYTVCFALVLCLIFSVQGKQALHYWLGSKVTETQIIIIYNNTLLLFIFFAFSMPGMMARSVLVSVGRHWEAAKAESWSNWIGFGAGLLLLVSTNLGAKGMVVGICIAFALRGFGGLLIYLSKYFNIPIIHWLPGIFIGPLIALMIVVIAYNSLRLYSNMHDVFITLCSVVIMLISVWILVVENKHREAIKRYLGQRRSNS